MRLSAAWLGIAVVTGGAAAARADTFGGFSGVDRPYLVNQDRACTPLVVKDGAASGVPACAKAAADVLAKLDIKPPVAQSGATASFSATASGRTLTVTRASGDAVVAWDAPDPIGKIVGVYAAHDEDRVAVAYTVRRAGRELTDVVAFDLIAHGGGAAVPPGSVIGKVIPDGIRTGSGTGTGSAAAPVADAPPVDPEVAKAIAVAHKAPKAKAAAAWQAVLVLDPDSSEARYQLAALAGAAKKPADALARLIELAASHRADAIEFLVQARFDPAFAALRADAKFRAAVGLDRAPATPYERFMGFGGQWEQTGTACDKATVSLVALRDRTFKLRVKTACEGQVMNLPFHGTWQVAPTGSGIVLTLPSSGKAATEADQAPCEFERSGDEDALHCVVGKDLDFVVLPTRR
jgi:hypothetical protein